MRRDGAAVAILALALGLACTQRTAPANAGISGTFDLALMGDLLFVTSTDRSELRVLDVSSATAAERDWVRAPNPLEPLAIPVLERPVSLVRDLRYGSGAAAGLEESGPYLYALGAGVGEVSVVLVDPEHAAPRDLTEIRRLTTPGPVSAAAAIGPVTSTSNSQLFLATFSGDGATIWHVQLPPPAALDASTPLPLRPVASYPGFTVTSMQALPDRNEVAVALRSHATPRTGRAFALRADGSERVAFQFPGPVRALQTHPGGTGTESGTASGIQAGVLLFGILDEEACPPPGCSGVVAVNVSDGSPHDVAQSGVPMKPLRFGDGLPINVSFAPVSALLVTREDAGTLQTGGEAFLLLGMATATDGNIYFFDAWNGQYIDAAPGPASATVQYFPRTDGGAVEVEPGLGLAVAPRAGEGVATFNETVVVAYEGVFPGLFDVPSRAADGGTLLQFPASAGADLGDLVQLRLDAGPGRQELCPAELTVNSRDDVAGTLSTTDVPPPGCADHVAFRVRAAGSSPYVVVSTATGYLGRMGHFRDFSLVRNVRPDGGPDYSYFPEGVDPRAPPPPLLAFRIEGKPPSTQRDSRYLINILANFSPYFFRVDTQSQFGLGPGWELPHSVLRLPAGGRPAFASYPSFRGGNGTTGALLEFQPALIAPNAPNVQNLKPYR